MIVCLFSPAGESFIPSPADTTVSIQGICDVVMAHEKRSTATTSVDDNFDYKDFYLSVAEAGPAAVKGPLDWLSGSAFVSPVTNESDTDTPPQMDRGGPVREHLWPSSQSSGRQISGCGST